MRKRARRNVGAAFFGVGPRSGFGAGGLTLDVTNDDHDAPAPSPGSGHAGPQEIRWPEGEPSDVAQHLTLDQNQRMPYHEGAAPQSFETIDLGEEAPLIEDESEFEPHAERGVNLKELDRGRVQGPLGPYQDWAGAYDDGTAGVHMGRRAGVGAEELPRNADGTVTLYHGTTAEGARRIIGTGTLTSAGEPDVYLTTAKTGTGYGDGTVVAVDVDPRLLEIDDEFPDGRKDFRLHVPSKVVRVSNPRMAAGLPAVGQSARRLAGEIARRIEQAQQAAGITPMRAEDRRYLHVFRDNELEVAQKAARQLTGEGVVFKLLDYLDPGLVRTEKARSKLQWSTVGLAPEYMMKSSKGHLDPSTGDIAIRVDGMMMLSSLAENVGALEATLAHEIRHAIDWAYTGRNFLKQRHPGGQQEETAHSRAFWEKYLANPTELMAWAGNVAHKLEHRPRGWEDLAAMLKTFTINVRERSYTAQVEARDPGESDRILEVPIMELIPTGQRPRFLQMVLKAYDQLNPGYGGGKPVNPWHLRKEDVVNRKKIPTSFMPKFLELGYLYQVRGGMVDQTEFPNWRAWVQGNSSDQLAMELENNYDAYQVLRQLPQNQLGEYPDLTDLIERWRAEAGLPHVPRVEPEPEENETWEQYRERQQRERATPRYTTPEQPQAPAPAMVEPVQAGLRIAAGRIARPAGTAPWVAVDLDGTILSEEPGMAAAGRFGEVLPGAREALRELEGLGWRVSIYTARFDGLNEQQDFVLRRAIEKYLKSKAVPFSDVWVGPKPRADWFVDNKAIHFGGDWNQVLLALTSEGVSAQEPDEGDVGPEPDAGTGLIDTVDSGNDFGNDGLDNRRDKSLRRPPGVEEVLY